MEKGKLVLAGTTLLTCTWVGANLRVVNATGVELFNSVLYNDIIDIEDVAINGDGDGVFLVRKKALAKTESSYGPSDYEPKIKYGYETQSKGLEVRTISDFVSLV